MRFVFYPHDIEKSTAEFSGNAEFQEGFFKDLRRYAMYFKSHDSKLISAAAVAMVNTAYSIGREVRFTQDASGRYERIEVESRGTAE